MFRFAVIYIKHHSTFNTILRQGFSMMTAKRHMSSLSVHNDDVETRVASTGFQHDDCETAHEFIERS